MSENTEAQIGKSLAQVYVCVCVFFASLASLPQTGGGFVTFLLYLDINKGSSFISLSASSSCFIYLFLSHVS
ncbi:hypothetical protein Bca101_047352 [Brassica carinata]